MQNTVDVNTIVNQVISTIAIIGPLAASGTFGLTELLKKFGLSSRLIGLAAVVLGFILTILLFQILSKVWFSPLAILTGIIVGFATPGSYSVAKSTLPKTDTSTTDKTVV